VKDNNKDNNTRIAEALLKKAVGYSVDEVVSEYVNEEETGQVKLIKKKVTTKHIPPDSTATKTLLEFFYSQNTSDFRNMSDAELQEEKERLLKMLASSKEQETKEEE